MAMRPRGSREQRGGEHAPRGAQRLWGRRGRGPCVFRRLLRSRLTGLVRGGLVRCTARTMTTWAERPVVLGRFLGCRFATLVGGRLIRLECPRARGWRC